MGLKLAVDLDPPVPPGASCEEKSPSFTVTADPSWGSVPADTHILLSSLKVRWRRDKVDWMLASIQFPGGPSMHGINYQPIV